MSVFYPACRASMTVLFDSFGQAEFDAKGNPVQGPLLIPSIVPKSANVHSNSYKEADTWELVFDAKLLPFSPELIRSIGVDIWMFSLSSLDEDPKPYLTQKKVLVSGLADEANLHTGGDSREFRISGRDYTGLLIDRDWDPRTKIPVGRDLVSTVQTIVDYAVNKTQGGLTLYVVWESAADIPIVGHVGKSVTSKKKQGAATPARPGATGPTKTGISVKADSKCWDVIYKLCLSYGFIVFVKGRDVVISDPQSQTVLSTDKAKKVAYGADLEELNIDRKLGREKVPQIKVVSYDFRTHKPISAVFPAAKDKTPTSVGTKKDEVQTHVINGVSDLTQLKRIAELRYNSLSRHEATLKFKTKNLTSLERPNQPKPGMADLLELRAGDPIVIGFDPFNDEEMRMMTGQERRDHLQALGYTQNVANIVAQEYDKLNRMERPFYTKEANFVWDHKEGISIDVEAVNYVSVERDEKETKTGFTSTPNFSAASVSFPAIGTK